MARISDKLDATRHYSWHCQQRFRTPESVPAIESDSNFKMFERARANFLPDAPKFTASFTGKLEYIKHGKGFGYYGRHRARLIVYRVFRHRSAEN